MLFVRQSDKGVNSKSVSRGKAKKLKVSRKAAASVCVCVCVPGEGCEGGLHLRVFREPLAHRHHPLHLSRAPTAHPERFQQTQPLPLGLGPESTERAKLGPR